MTVDKPPPRAIAVQTTYSQKSFFTTHKSQMEPRDRHETSGVTPDERPRIDIEILEVLEQEHRANPSLLSDEVGEQASYVSKRLAALIDDGLVSKRAYALYELAEGVEIHG